MAVSASGIYDFVRTTRAKFGLGGLISRYSLPDDLKELFRRDLTSFMVFGRIKIISERVPRCRSAHAGGERGGGATPAQKRWHATVRALQSGHDAVSLS